MVQILKCGHWCAYWSHYPNNHPRKFTDKGYGPRADVPCCICRAEDYAKQCENKYDWSSYWSGKVVCKACVTRLEAASLSADTVTLEDFGIPPRFDRDG